MEFQNQGRSWRTLDTVVQEKTDKVLNEIIIWNTNVDVFTRDNILELKHRIDQQLTTPDIIAISEVKHTKIQKGIKYNKLLFRDMSTRRNECHSV